jgi:hypothetical protein
MSLLFLSLACQNGTGPDTTDSGAPKYYGDVQPILQQHCVRCHTEGGVAPMSLEDPASTVLLAETIRGKIDSGLMPPPAPDPSCAPYKDSDKWTLSEAEKQVIRDWADGGAELGDPADATVYAGPESTAPFDAELRGSVPYSPHFRSDGNDYRCFRLDVGNATAEYLTGFEALVDQSPEVHHVVLFRDSSNSASASTSGFSCSGFGDDNWQYLGAWAPGASPLLLPEDAGIRFEPNTTLVLQMHYFGAGGETGTPDQSGFGLHLADSVTHQVFAMPFGANQFTIPAGEKYDKTGVERWAPTDGRWKILGMWPHMHVLGDGMDMHIDRKDGTSQCLVDLEGWDFHNQIVVDLDEAVDLGPGDQVSTTCFWDNRELSVNPKQFNDPPEDVKWGEGTHDEMCFSFTYLMQP